MKIALFSTKSYDREYFDRYGQDYPHEITYFDNRLTSQSVPLAEGFRAVCAFVNDSLDAEVIEKLSALGVELLVLRCAGYNHVDLDAAKKAKMAIVRVPAYSPHAVAEHAVALILTLNRKTHKAYNRVREGNFSLDRLDGFDLYQKTIGVIGTGKIGQVFCKIMQGFGCKVLAYDPFPNKELIAQGIVYSSMEELLKTSDIVSLHCPLTPENYHLIQADTLDKMKEGVMIINSSRGALIDTKAIIKALKSRKVGYLGIDVYEQEADFFFQDHSETIITDDTLMRLMSFPNVLITSHQGFFTDEALAQIAITSLENLTAFEKGEFIEENTVLRA
ncbi:2-hydroxyacid dehydrogenase [Arundinibacter roseus]|uniref:2-hydroxyacid dehydrogenase n=1 Tax=Arundinibacter roseus TaxID=2070510 RepID=A0A4R4KBF3_9BACT|nr:2-hydroxyacid dehydrogenase [Arundinibacter roseus]TDB65207.1 2-hydroxyacid dehydrogenase [Arundinibacter roseus]